LELYFEYEQSPRDRLEVYKLGGPLDTSGKWRLLNDNSRSLYRVTEDIFQLVSPGEMLTDAELSEVCGWIEAAAPWPASVGEPEVYIARHADGFEMWSHWLLNRADGVVFLAFTRDEFYRAYEALVELERQS
jgi:hypothetical protein